MTMLETECARVKDAADRYCERHHIAREFLPVLPCLETANFTEPRPGCYAFFNARGELRYIGKGDVLAKRVGDYFKWSGAQPNRTLHPEAP